jgi:hypothetical protein
MDLHDDIEIEGRVKVYSGIPLQLLKKYPNHLKSIHLAHPGMRTVKRANFNAPIQDDDNLIVNVGKTHALNRIFQDNGFFQYVAIGDGAFTFSNGEPQGIPTFPASGDDTLSNAVAGKAIQSQSEGFEGDFFSGYTKSLLTTFISTEDVDLNTQWTNGNTNHLINEIGIFSSESNGNYSNCLAKFILRNQEFSPLGINIYTFEWIIRFGG